MALFQETGVAQSCNFMQWSMTFGGTNTTTLKEKIMAISPAHFGYWSILDPHFRVVMVYNTPTFVLVLGPMLVLSMHTLLL